MPFTYDDVCKAFDAIGDVKLFIHQNLQQDAAPKDAPSLNATLI